jgi:hypothetical protein
VRWIPLVLLASCATTQVIAPSRHPARAEASSRAPFAAAPGAPIAPTSATPPAPDPDEAPMREEAIVRLRAFVEKYPNDARFTPDAARRLLELMVDTGDAARLAATIAWLRGVPVLAADERLRARMRELAPPE